MIVANEAYHVSPQAKEALERRRLERKEEDERMRKPWQQPPEPKKEILRKGAKQKPVKSSAVSAAYTLLQCVQRTVRVLSGHAHATLQHASGQGSTDKPNASTLPGLNTFI